MSLRDRRDISDDVDLVAQRFEETGFRVEPCESGRGYKIHPTPISENYGGFSINHDGDQVKVLVNSGRTTGQHLACDMLRDAGIQGKVEYR